MWSRRVCCRRGWTSDSRAYSYRVGENFMLLVREASQEEPTVKRSPLPKFQLFIVFLIQFAEPVTATVIYPFVNQFVRDTGVIGGDERRTGYYAGVIGSAFFFAEAVTVFHWGWASDRVGRRPILLLGPIGLALAMLSFGVAEKYWMLVFSRCIQGIFNGNIGVSKTVIAEITDATNIADAFALMPLNWSLGITMGPILGGLLAEPAKRWPLLFGEVAFFHAHPYFLPCAAAGLCALLPGILGLVGLKETLPSALRKQDRRKCVEDTRDATSSTPLLAGDIPEYGSRDRDNSPAHAEGEHAAKGQADAPPPFRALLIPQVLLPLAFYMVLAFIDMSSQVLLPLMYSTSIPIGGLGLDPYRIGVILSVFGFVNAIVQLLFLPPLVRRWGPRNICFAATISYLGNIGLYLPLLYFASRAGRVDGKVWATIVLQLATRLTNSMAWGSIQIIIVDSAPSRASLGATNGLAQALGCFARSVGPAVASSLFSLSLERNLAGGKMVYFVLLGCTLLALRLTFLLPQKLRSQKD
ncbi:putative major facilitator superfamily protein [Lyophyllum shimeji]|uniref:Major facilitator superfamily protein n=1 Tax=Lyophyllum shimeji TaxID=47721 RepID=A0A9P3UUI7_LYOSH|nr:putative major facilitator superfamily protein [Lyophyllum shimeji]